ncbi:MAG TPA: hypothetical protein VFC96_02195 [Anaerovoracaceae bacterium]|nr:hypothetical protein [Anaerovoracaceae bacterium]
MSILNQIAEKYNKVAIIGMAKNAGKTTTLNYLIDEAFNENISLGVTSTGRDGEGIDLVTGTDKPRVYLEAGTIVSVPVQLHELSDAGLEILSMTRYFTALGQILLCRVVEGGYVQIAGPANTSDHKSMCVEMMDLGAELILIDGAVDRKSIADPTVSDAIVLATGAVISRSLKRIVEETTHVVSLYRLPLLNADDVRKRIVEDMASGNVRLFKKDAEINLDLATGLMAGKVLDKAIDKDTDWVYIPGALTHGVISDINPAKLKKTTFILKDPTRIFIGPTHWKQLCRKGLRVKVLENIEIAAITVNPYSPLGYSFDHEELLDAMKRAMNGIPVMDVRYSPGR